MDKDYREVTKEEHDKATNYLEEILKMHEEEKAKEVESDGNT